VGSAPAQAAIQINVANVGSILNESVSLPAEATPGLAGRIAPGWSLRSDNGIGAAIKSEGKFQRENWKTSNRLRLEQRIKPPAGAASRALSSHFG
jgi:hypothetical protein